MTNFSVRPRFKILSDLSIDALMIHIENGLKNTSLPIEGKVFKSHGLLRIMANEQHFWSPQLNVSFEETDAGIVIRGMYGPHPAVWAIFLFGYALLGIAFFFISLMGFVKLHLHLSHRILYTLPAVAFFLVLLYFLAQTGRKMGLDQTRSLHHFFEQSIGEKINFI
jgi:hypothetical protein